MDMQLVEGWIARLPGGAALVKREKQQRVQERRDHVRAIEALRVEHARRDAPLAKREAEAKAACDATNKLLIEQAETLRLVRNERAGALGIRNMEITKHEVALRDSADHAKIGGLRNWILDQRDLLRNGRVGTIDKGRMDHWNNRRDPDREYSNAVGMAEVVAAIPPALERCAQLPYEVHDDLDAVIAEIRNSVPMQRVHEFEVVEAAV